MTEHVRRLSENTYIKVGTAIAVLTSAVTAAFFAGSTYFELRNCAGRIEKVEGLADNTARRVTIIEAEHGKFTARTMTP